MLLIDYSKNLLRYFDESDMVKAQTFRNYASINLMSIKGEKRVLRDLK